MIECLLSRPGAGYTYYSGYIDGLLPSFNASSFSLPLLIVSDKISIDSEWELVRPGSVLKRVVEELSDRKILEEVGVADKIPKKHADFMLSWGMSEFIKFWANQNDFRGSEIMIERAFDSPYEFLEKLLHSQIDLGRGPEKIPYGYIQPLLDALFTYAAKDLRSLYSQAIAMSGYESSWGTFDKTRTEFHRQWSKVRARLKKDLKTSEKLGRWTDILTIPAALASIVAPLVGAIPIITWIANKTTKYKAEIESKKKFPWLSVAEQMSEVGLKIEETFPNIDDNLPK